MMIFGLKIKNISRILKPYNITFGSKTIKIFCGKSLILRLKPLKVKIFVSVKFEHHNIFL